MSIIDIFSKYAIVIPMKNKEGPTITSTVMEGMNKNESKQKTRPHLL